MVNARTKPQQSRDQLQRATKSSNRNFNDMWRISPNCKLFRRKVIDAKSKMPRTVKTGKTTEYVTRPNRVLGANTIKTLASLAASDSNVNNIQDLGMLRCNEQGEIPNHPVTPSIPQSTANIYDYILTRYAKLIVANAAMIRKNIGGKTRINAGMLHAAAVAVNSRIAATTGYVPENVIINVPNAEVAKKKKKKKEEEESKKKKTVD